MISNDLSITGRICVLNDLQLGKINPVLVPKFVGGSSNTKEKQPSIHFSFDMQDNVGSKMHCVAFDDVAKQNFPRLLLNRVYTIQKISLQSTNTRYTDIPHPCMVVLTTSTIIIEESIEVEREFRQLDQEELHIVKLENLGNIDIHSHIGNLFSYYFSLFF